MTGAPYALPLRTIRPYADNVLIALHTREHMTAGGVVVPQAAAEARGVVRATVLSAGPGHRTKAGAWVPTSVVAGDIVLVGTDCGDRYGRDHEGRDVRVVRESEIAAVVGSAGDA